MLGYIGTHAMNPALQKLRYDPVFDFAPIGLVATSATLLVANVNAPVRDVADLVRQLRAQPDRYRYASAGAGTAPQFAAELFMRATGTSMFGVPHLGAAPAIDDTIVGQTQFMFPSMFTAWPHLRAGRLRALAVAGPRRSPGLPDVPTLAECGIEGVDLTQWYALFAPAGTPADACPDAQPGAEGPAGRAAQRPAHRGAWRGSAYRHARGSAMRWSARSC